MPDIDVFEPAALDTYLFYIYVQHFAPDNPTGGPDKDGFVGHMPRARRMTEIEALAEAKNMLEEERNFDRSYFSMLAVGNPRPVYRVKVRKIIAYADVYII
jgi:hypothetical protein